MKYFTGFLTLCVVFCSFGSAANDIKGKINLENEIISPEGYVLCHNEEELKIILFEDDFDSYQIGHIDFVETGSGEGLIAYVNYDFQGVNKKLAVVAGNISVGFENSGEVEVRAREIQAGIIAGGGSEKIMIYSCKEQDCCNVAGEVSVDTGLYTFSCECEEAPDQKMECSLEITEISEEG